MIFFLTNEDKKELQQSIDELANKIQNGGGESTSYVTYMRVYDGYIQYSSDKENWTDLITLAELTGPKGDTGEAGPQGLKGDTGEAGPKGDAGVSGVYVGSGDMPDGYNIQIDPTGDADLFIGEGVSF